MAVRAQNMTPGDKECCGEASDCERVRATAEQTEVELKEAEADVKEDNRCSLKLDRSVPVSTWGSNSSAATSSGHPEPVEQEENSIGDATNEYNTLSDVASTFDSSGGGICMGGFFGGDDSDDDDDACLGDSDSGDES